MNQSNSQGKANKNIITFKQKENKCGLWQPNLLYKLTPAKLGSMDFTYTEDYW